MPVSFCKEASAPGLPRDTDRAIPNDLDEKNEWMSPGCPLWFAPLVSRPLSSSISTSHPLIGSIPWGMWRVAIRHHPNSLLASHSPWQLYSSACLSASDTILWRLGFESKAQRFCAFLSLSIHLSHSHDASLCMTEMPEFIIHGLLLSLLNQSSSSLYLCHLATTLWDRWGIQHVLFL